MTRERGGGGSSGEGVRGGKEGAHAWPWPHGVIDGGNEQSKSGRKKERKEGSAPHAHTQIRRQSGRKAKKKVLYATPSLLPVPGRGKEADSGLPYLTSNPNPFCR